MAEVVCGVCGIEPKKYKCPTCALPSCSLSCFKNHKITHADDPADVSANNQTSGFSLPEPPPPAPVPRYLKSKVDFAGLGTNPNFKDLLNQNPELLRTLQRVYAATIEPTPEDETRRRRFANAANRGRGSRGRGRGRGGRFGGAEERDNRWTQKKGDANGMNMLKRTRTGGSDDKEKESLKAFVELIDEHYGESKKSKNAS